MKKIIVPALLISVISMGILLFMGYRSAPRTAYVEVSKLYNEFQFKKELDAKMRKQQLQRSSVMDSLELELQLMSGRLKESNGEDKQQLSQFNYKRETFYRMQQELQQENAELAKNHDEQIFKQLDQYIKDYGTANDYTYIFGNMNNGTMLYCEESKNVTPEVIRYVNNKYNGLKE